MIGFGATAKGYFHACALRHFWGFSLSAAAVEVAVAFLMHRTFAQSPWVRACIQHSLTEKQTKLKKILDIPDDDKIAAHAQEMQDRIADYLRITDARLKIDSIKQVRCELK